MNRQITRLFIVFGLMFGVLIFATSWWSVLGADGLKLNTANKRPLLEQQQIPRGLILARDGTKLATNKRLGRRQTKRYYRQYPTGSLFSHSVGYAYISSGASGLEQKYNDVLSGTGSDLTSLLDELKGGPDQGSDIRTAFDPAGQREAVNALAGRAGSIVALDPQTGEVKVSASVPGFDPNRIPRDLSQLNKDNTGPLVNRATQAQYPPGSTFKTVTAAAALDTGKYKPDTIVNGKASVVVSGVPLQNFGGESFGSISFTDALTHSVNTVFGPVGEDLGKKTMLKYMKRFGMEAQPPLDLPSGQIAPSGVLGRNGRPLSANDTWDVGRVAIGQEPHLFVTPLQMAMVAAAIGNKGRLMKPHFVTRVIAPDGRVTDRIDPVEESTVMSESAASDLSQMMANVVKSGTGTGGALQGIQVAGKTGTADNPTGGNYAWFIAFAPVSNPKVAIAVVVEKTQQSQTGGEVAAPLAARVMKVLLNEK